MKTVRFRISLPAIGLALCATAALAAPDATPDTNLSSSDMLSRAKDSVSKMQETVRDIAQLQEQAKKQKDVIKLNCVNDKMVQVKGHMAVADTAMGNLNEAMGKGDDDGRRHEYQRVSILFQKVLVLGTEARNCVGDDLSYVGGVQRSEEIDPSIPQKDFTAFPLPPVDTTRPPLATAF